MQLSHVFIVCLDFLCCSSPLWVYHLLCGFAALCSFYDHWFLWLFPQACFISSLAPVCRPYTALYMFPKYMCFLFSWILFLVCFFVETVAFRSTFPLACLDLLVTLIQFWAWLFLHMEYNVTKNSHLAFSRYSTNSVACCQKSYCH